MSGATSNGEGPIPEDSRCGDDPAPDLGDLIVVLLAGSLAGLRDRLHLDGFHEAADLMADLVEAADDYLIGRTPSPPTSGSRGPSASENGFHGI